MHKIFCVFFTFVPFPSFSVFLYPLYRSDIFFLGAYVSAFYLMRRWFRACLTFCGYALLLIVLRACGLHLWLKEVNGP